MERSTMTVRERFPAARRAFDAGTDLTMRLAFGALFVAAKTWGVVAAGIDNARDGARRPHPR